MGIGDIFDEGMAFIGENPVGTAVGAAIGGAVVGGAVTGIVMASSKRKRISKNRNSRKRGRRIKHSRRGWAQDRRRRSKQKWEVAYQKRKKKKGSKRRKGVHYTKKGQPYVIMSSGKARFIKKTKRRTR